MSRLTERIQLKTPDQIAVMRQRGQIP